MKIDNKKYRFTVRLDKKLADFVGRVHKKSLELAKRNKWPLREYSESKAVATLIAIAQGVVEKKGK